MAMVRDTAVQKLRDLTIAVALAATAAGPLIAWLGSATIPGVADTSGPAGNAADRGDQALIGTEPAVYHRPPRKEH